ncbi:hypothetical protein BDV37DRAFT_291155 [Aspergillus pseudonomiae]|uniref:Uncharacterized protein n=1 Tax=Aspergillus pseudonomiae TaxID=1506151 RepID=A0A5N7CXH5_9EURO|nr:uncharacterized protein BDV37DRAFT_291155 [Aspergillus pseudonomiae]KAE8398268.1 hypothetical protein BDV37DRAFT_291155 [Aspergillus pseudonomiae]
MGLDFGPYLRLAEQSHRSSTPAVSLELKAPETLYLESPFGIEVVLRRDDTDPRSCIFYWSPYAPAVLAAQFILFRHTPDGLERIEVGKGLWEAPDMLSIARLGQGLFELEPNGSSRYLLELGVQYRDALRPGERYELLWPGGESFLWDWGNIQGHLGVELRRREPCLFIPGFHVIYHSSSKGPGDLTPITFHVFNLLEGNLQRQRGQEWGYFESEEMPYRIYDDPDIEVSPSQHADFVSLQPGDSWTQMDSLELPSDIKVGEVFKYEFTDRVLDWWDWGTKEDQLRTTVKLPCWVGAEVIEPRDNEGRPAVVVPASNVVVFTIV